MNTQLKKIGIAEPRQLWYNSKDGISRKKFCYIINTFKLDQEMKRYLQDNDYVIMDEEVICDEESIDSGYIQWIYLIPFKKMRNIINRYLSLIF